jgi:predicted pyridoxine 5'-phosphate oxidase superfamily flavin-nucleotide-binding protein
MPEMLDESMQDFISDYKLGLVATVDQRGFPHVSPKGTFVVLDNETLAFGDIRSPGTINNIKGIPQVSINFINPVSRRGLWLMARQQ